MDFTEVKLMMVKVRMIRVAQVSPVRSRRRLRLLTPRKKDATNAFHRLISSIFICRARRCNDTISASNRKKMIRVTIIDSPMIKNARMTTMGL